jgi:hypothetical protein
MKLPDKKYDSNGKVKNWSSLWPEAKELETLVASGYVDGLTTAQIFSKYPHFGQKFLYKQIFCAHLVVVVMHQAL